MLPDGEMVWQKLQGHVYGRGLASARPFDGLGSFLRRACAAGDTILIVSHKTEFGHFDADRVNLRDAARDWIAAQGYFDPRRIGVSTANVFFENTRAEKIRRIAATGCDVFVDDLEEVLLDPDFPSAVERVLFSHRRPTAIEAPYAVCANWRAVEEVLFR